MTTTNHDTTPTDLDTPDRYTVGSRQRVAMLGVAAAALTIDIGTKIVASSTLTTPRPIGPITLRLIHNDGIAFGLGGFLPSGVLVAATAAIVAVLIVAAWRGSLGSPAAAGLIVGGAVGNVADRMTGGSVIDFIDIGRWPVFNLADVLLLSGLALLAISTSRNGADTTSQATDPTGRTP